MPAHGAGKNQAKPSTAPPLLAHRYMGRSRYMGGRRDMGWMSVCGKMSVHRCVPVNNTGMLEHGWIPIEGKHEWGEVNTFFASDRLAQCNACGKVENYQTRMRRNAAKPAAKYVTKLPTGIHLTIYATSNKRTSVRVTRPCTETQTYRRRVVHAKVETTNQTRDKKKQIKSSYRK